jgi:hypothetical protein
MELAEIKEKFVGVWKLDRSENFQEFLQEVGKKTECQCLSFAILQNFYVSIDLMIYNSTQRIRNCISE